MSEELFRKYRPKTFKAVIGQDRAVSLLTGLLKTGLPHQLLFTGPSGCGKTTLARILKAKLKCGNRDWTEINCADFKGIDMVRDIRRTMNLVPIDGETRIWLIDEAHKLTTDAQNAFLKILEEPPASVYFFLATTDPNKLLKTIQTRCTEVATASLSVAATTSLIRSVVDKEDRGTITNDVLDKLVEASDGSARKALVILQQVLSQDGEDSQLATINAATANNQAISLCRALLNPRIQWADVAKLLKTIDEEPESLRRAVLGYASGCLLGNTTTIHARAYEIIAAFGENYYDTGRAGLVASCYEMTRPRR